MIEGVRSEGAGWQLVPVLPKVDLDFGFLGSGATYTRVATNRVWAVGWNQVMLLVRLHAKNASTSSKVDVILRESDPTEDDDADFVVTSPQDYLTATVTDGTAAPALIKSAVAMAPGPCLRVLVKGTGGTTARAAYTLSADLLLRAAPTLVVEVTRHDYNNAVDLTPQYLPINSELEGATIGYWNTWLAPGDGELVEITIQGSTAGASTSLGFHRNGSTTPDEAQTVTLSAGVSATVPFAKARFSKGDRLHISVDPTTVLTNVWAVCRWRYWKL